MKLRHLDIEDKQSRTWSRLKKHLEARLEELRIDNDDLEKGLDETNRMRGRIAEIKSLIALEKTPPA